MINKLLFEHAGLPNVLDLAVHLVNFFGWMSKEGHSELLLSALFYQSTPSCLKVRGGGGGGGVGWGGDLCDFSVSPSPFGLDFGTLDFGTSDLGLTIQFTSNVCLIVFKGTTFQNKTRLLDIYNILSTIRDQR